MDLGIAGGTNSAAYGINSNGMVVGYTMMANGGMEPMMSADDLSGTSGMMNMGMGNLGAVGGESWFVNDAGAIAAGGSGIIKSSAQSHLWISGNGLQKSNSDDTTRFVYDSYGGYKIYSGPGAGAARGRSSRSRDGPARRRRRRS